MLSWSWVREVLVGSMVVLQLQRPGTWSRCEMRKLSMLRVQ
jgi:hypothetical protein